MVSDQSRRLDTLMRITDTSNSALARELSFDPSYICRIRGGRRGFPTREPFLTLVAGYLARRIREPYQVHAVERELGLPEPLPDDLSHRAWLIARWLEGVGANAARQANVMAVDELMGDAPASASSPACEAIAAGDVDGGLPTSPDASAPAPDAAVLASPVSDSPALLSPTLAGVQARFGVGCEGRRAATLAILEGVVERGGSHELLLYSDESMEWLTQDEAFLSRWSSLLQTILASGSTITIAHTLTRDVTEMFAAVRQWLPLYLTGRVRSCYVPRIRDGINRRSLFVVRDVIALAASSVESGLEGTAAVVVSDPGLVRCFEREIRGLMALCRPLAAMESPDDEHVRTAAERFLRGGSDLRLLHNLPVGTRIEEALSCFPAGIARPLVELDRGGMSRVSPRLPGSVVAAFRDDAGALVLRLGTTPMVMLVEERLTTSAFAEYLG